MEYTAGFIFDADFQHVLLVHKKHPQWQAGKLNGPGGKFEEGKTSHQCVAREIYEETSLQIAPNNWKYVFREI